MAYALFLFLCLTLNRPLGFVIFNDRFGLNA